jgi:hypothetical protein
MTTNDIRRLLEAFYNGNTSADEDRILMEYFGGEDVADELAGEKELFLSMYRAGLVEVPSSLESKLADLVDELAKKEAERKNEPEIKLPNHRRAMWMRIGGAAAGVAILVTATLFFNKPVTVTPELATVQIQPEWAEMSEADKQAIKEAEAALVLLSGKFNKGMNQLTVVSSNIDKTNEILNKTFNRNKDKES